MRHSVVIPAIRSFAVTLATMVGIFLGIFVLMVFLGVISKPGDFDTDERFTPKLLANAEGVRKVLSRSAPVILQLEVSGFIGADQMDGTTIRDMLLESREGIFKNDRVKGILLRINSGGGSAVASDDIYRALMEYKERYQVPIYAYVDGICASGALYIAAAADNISASDASIIGSVGVLLSPFFNVTELMQKIGVESKTLSAGKDKDAFNPFTPWQKDEGESIRVIVDDFYTQFVDLMVARRPKLDKEKLVNEYGANIFPAHLAAEHGFIDSAGKDRDTALKELLTALNIEDDNYQVVQLKEEKWYRNLLESKTSLLQGEVKHTLELPPELSANVRGLPLYYYQPPTNLLP